MKFTDLINNLSERRVIQSADVEITGIAYDSRRVKPGNLFIAMKGGSFDGHQFIPQAVKAGAVAIVAEREVEAIQRPMGYVVVPDGRRAMGEMAATFYGHPARKMRLVGVTGTSGKTTVTHLIQSILSASGLKAGLVGTLGARIDDELIPTGHTTPESVDIQRILSDMLSQGVNGVAMEASSHGLHQGRTLGCEFDCGVFTNIARDHLDYHETFENYLQAKLVLFRDYPKMSTKEFTAAINADDSCADRVQAATSGRVMTFAVESKADLVARNIAVTDHCVEFDLVHEDADCEKELRVRLNIGGYFNVYNALAASAAALALGIDKDAIVKGLGKARQVPGRFESVDCGQDFAVIVDYAHTPDELENVLRTARNLTSGRLIAVFGCGGDRDRGKRPIMGGIAAELSDLVIITSDNPRSEDPEDIISEITAGIPEASRANIQTITDRREAIREAIGKARTGDIVVIAGKGHEDYQIFADRTIHFDDREVAREALAELVS